MNGSFINKFEHKDAKISMKKMDTRTLAGTTVLAALVVVLDYTMKYSGLKISFFLLPDLKFDFIGVPIVLSSLLFGLIPGVFTSLIAFVAILARSGNYIGSSMKAVAELSTVVGISLGLWKFSRYRRSISFVLGVATRCLVMFFLNLALFSLAVSPFIAAFNVIQGSISILGGYLIYEAVKKRAPQLTKKTRSA